MRNLLLKEDIQPTQICGNPHAQFQIPVKEVISIFSAFVLIGHDRIDLFGQQASAKE